MINLWRADVKVRIDHHVFNILKVLIYLGHTKASIWKQKKNLVILAEACKLLRQDKDKAPGILKHKTYNVVGTKCKDVYLQ